MFGRVAAVAAAAAVLIFAGGASSCGGGTPAAPGPGDDPNATDVLFKVWLTDENGIETNEEISIEVTLYAFGVQTDANGVPTQVPAQIQDYVTGEFVTAPHTYYEIAPIDDWQRFGQGVVGATITASAFLFPAFTLHCKISDGGLRPEDTTWDENAAGNPSTILPSEATVICIWP